MKHEHFTFRGYTLSGFCMQISLLYQSAIPLYEGLAVMAEDSTSQEEKELLLDMSDKLRMGYSFSEVVKDAGCFPSYMEEMIVLGEQTGTLDAILRSLSSHYEKEANLTEGLRRAVTYPAIMVCMLLVILFVLFTKIMPIFSDVYEQLGAKIPSVTQSAIRIGGFVSGLSLFVIAVIVVAVAMIRLMGTNRKQFAFVEALRSAICKKSHIRKLTAIRRLCSTMAISLRCGLRTEEGLLMAEKIVEHPLVEEQIKQTRQSVMTGTTFYDAIKETRLFSGFDLQLIRVASRAGQLDGILDKLADDYDEKASASLDSMIAHLEPIIVTILAAAVGLILLSVMLPLVGILSAIG